MRSVSMTTASNSGAFARALSAAALAFRQELARQKPAGEGRRASGRREVAVEPERGFGGELGDPELARDFRDGFSARGRLPELR